METSAAASPTLFRLLAGNVLPPVTPLAASNPTRIEVRIGHANAFVIMPVLLPSKTASHCVVTANEFAVRNFSSALNTSSTLLPYFHWVCCEASDAMITLRRTPPDEGVREEH